MNYDPDPNIEAAKAAAKERKKLLPAAGVPPVTKDQASAKPSLLEGISVTDTLTERGVRYGKFSEHADITQALKDVMRDTSNWKRLAPYQKEALEMNAHKIGRILNGDPDHDDSWIDIAGYAQLVADKLRGVER